MVLSTRLPEHVRTGINVRLFCWNLRVCWCLLFIIIIACEVIPRSPTLPPFPYYSYTTLKAVLFVLVGLLSPLTFWRFDSLGLGLFCSAAAAGIVEGIQSFSTGHHASYLEFGAKLVLLFLGFAYALNARYDRVLSIGPVHIGLLDFHWLSKQ